MVHSLQVSMSLQNTSQANSHVNFALLHFCKVVCHIRLVWIPASRSVSDKTSHFSSLVPWNVPTVW